MQLFARHLRRATPFDYERSVVEFDEVMTPLMDDARPCLLPMWGPHEFLLTGPLADWDVTDGSARSAHRHSSSAAGTTSCDSAATGSSRMRLPDNEFVIFGNSSHCIILEKEGDAYLAVVRDFVARVSARGD